MKQHIPNTLTCCNLVSGCIATMCGLAGHFQMALLWIIVGAVFDFFDGFAARLLHVASPIGKELDSLADDITFGFAPAAIVFAMLSKTALAAVSPLIPFLAFLIAAFSALRLAKFNLDERQTMGFIGLPTPANALFWAALSVSLPFEVYAVKWFPWLLLVLILLSSWLLISEIPMFALKFKSFGWKGNELRYTFILVGAVLLCVLGWGGFVAIIPLYVLASLVAGRGGNGHKASEEKPNGCEEN